MTESSLTFGPHRLFGYRTGAGSRTTARASRQFSIALRAEGLTPILARKRQ
jgi:hypothetical protein